MNTIQTPQKHVPRLHLKSQLRLRPSVKFQMHILAPSDKMLPMHALDQQTVSYLRHTHNMANFSGENKLQSSALYL